MKIFWKLFFSMLLVMTITFCIAGSVMISVFFDAAYEQAVGSAEDINRMFLRAFGNYMGTVSGQKQDLTEDIQTLAGEYLEEDTGVQIVNGEKESLYSDTFAKDMKKSTQIGTLLLKKNEEQYIQVVKCVQVGEEKYYASTWHNASSLFQERQEQFQLYRRILWYLPVISGVVSLILSGVLVRPLRKISRSARQIADGNLDHRLVVSSQDEIGDMAQDFNRMADSLAGKIIELEDASRRQKEFIGSFAHELKTPLTSIIGYADLLRSGRQTEEERFLSSSYIFQEGKRLEQLSLRLLDLIVLDHHDLQSRRCSLLSLFGDVESIMKPILDEEHITLELQVEVEGKAPEELQLEVEAELFKTVLINLVDNARKAVSENGNIWLSGREDEDVVMIEVRDDGRGIPLQEMQHITEAFYMVDKSRSRKQGGAGLGLSICEKIIALHGGDLLFAARDGGGTTVQIRLPQNMVSEDAETVSK